MSRSYVCVNIGDCEICGVTDHHLVEGVCPGCRPKVLTVTAMMRQLGKTAFLERLVARAALALKDLRREESIPLGAEADVSHLRLPKGGAR